jgi:hypothetical protein
MQESPEWYDKDKLVRIKFEKTETGWAIDMGDGKYRLANNPVRGMFMGRNPEVAQWGDLVKRKPNNGDDSWLELIEKFKVDEEPDGN